MKFDKKEIIEIIENAFTYIVVMAMFAYGIGKMVQFDGATNTNLKVSEMTAQQLMWAFYGYSRPFVLTLGFLEIIGGTLMLLKRTRILGCLFVSTILVNVILQDIFYNVNIGALRAAIIYQLFIIAILWFSKEKVIHSFRIITSIEKIDASKKKFFLKVIFSVLLFVAIRILEFYITTKW
nr:hypothetical protein [uncultured Flavobacterium sp.]